ncbi:MAG TPA: BON domain-containing protein [Myxococcota bacterium]|nr:BON domain-containing protein [Myxococcota bacterium]
MPFPFRAVVLSSAVVLVPVAGSAQSDEPQPRTLEQGVMPSDAQITQNIRRALTSTSGFSVDARNVQITTHDGEVTLRGQVRNDAERDAVITVARRVPGVTHIDQDLEVQPMDRNPGY